MVSLHSHKHHFVIIQHLGPVLCRWHSRPKVLIACSLCAVGAWALLRGWRWTYQSLLLLIPLRFRNPIQLKVPARTTITIPVKIVLGVAVAFQVYAGFFARWTVREGHVVVGYVVEEVDFVLYIKVSELDLPRQGEVATVSLRSYVPSAT